MAPVTRSSQHGRSVMQQSSRASNQALPAEERFDEASRDDYESSDPERDPFEADTGEVDPSRFYSSTIKELLEPLQQTADRVSRQAEEFARCLDKFNAARDLSDQELWEDACALLDTYKHIARRQKDLVVVRNARSRPSSQNRRSLGDSEREGWKIQFEADLWALTHDILLHQNPRSIADAQSSQETGLDKLNRYSKSQEIWAAFLESDVAAQEVEAVLSWLQDRYQASSPTVEEAIADVTTKSERGGIWSAGAFHTKNAIKSVKRTRSWPSTLDRENTGLLTTHKRAADGRPLVTQLDPDAQTRESAVLQPQDDFHEQAAWRACWEFLRRGGTQAEVKEYWAERKEVWRAASIRGTDKNSPTQIKDSPWLRIMNTAFNQTWMEACRLMCQNDDALYDYQAAVYAILCGDVPVSLKVCQTIDDHLFSMLNGSLVSRYQSYVEAFRRKIQSPGSITYQPPEMETEPIRQYLVRSSTDESTREEIRLPHKLIEAVLVSKDFDTFFVQQGKAAAQVAHSTGQTAHLMELYSGPAESDVAQMTAQDPDSIRMIAHLQLLFKALGYLQKSYESDEYMMDNNVANYIGWLQRQGKISLIPLYASKLSESRTPNVLGAILIDVIEPSERASQVRLMKQYGINLPGVIHGIYQMATYGMVEPYIQGTVSFEPPRITEAVGTGTVKNIKVKAEYMSDEIADEDEIAIRSVEWSKYMDAENWGKACYAVSSLYKIFLYSGRLSAARELSKRVPLTSVSLTALGINVHIAEPTEAASENDDDDEMDGLLVDEEAQSISPTRKRKQTKLHLLAKTGTSREHLAAQSLVWGQLEQLVVAMGAIETWAGIVVDVEENRENPSTVRSLKKELRASLDEVREAMFPLLEPDFLCTPADAVEQAVLDKLRRHYLPECILAYNAVLFFAGHAISRSWLVECMNLAQVVAEVGSLQLAMIEGGRMREFVAGLAWSANGMVEASELGAKSGKGKGARGVGERDKQLGLWNVKWSGSSGTADGLEALD